MASVTENNSSTCMFIPIPDNPLHLASSSRLPLFLLDSSPSPTPPSVLQRKSSLKSLKDNAANFNGPKHTVRWSSPISINMKPPNVKTVEDAYQKTISNPWSMSQSLTINEGSQYENATIVELDTHSEGKSSTGLVLSFTRPKALLSRPEELQARMNLMHVHKVILPCWSTTTCTPGLSKPSHSKCPSSTNLKPSSHRVSRPRPATFINIPRYSRSPYDSHPALLRLKRRSTTDPNNRRKKVRRTDENTSDSSVRESENSEAGSDGFPNLKEVLNQLLDTPLLSSSTTVGGYTTPKSGADDNDDDDDDEALSESESLFGDQKFMQGVEVPLRDVATAPRKDHSLELRVQQPWHPLNSIKVVNWTNALKRFDYLLQTGKMNWRCDDDLYDLLKAIDVEKDNITIELLKKTQVGKMIRKLSRCYEFEERSRIVAKRIYKAWVKMCRKVDE